MTTPNPTHTQCINHINQGKVLFKAQQYEQALKEFDAAIALVDLFPGVYLDRGATLHLLDRNERALNDLNIAIALFRPDDTMSAAARHNRATVQESQGNLAEAFEDFNRAKQQGFQQSVRALDRLHQQHGPIKINPTLIDQGAVALCEQGKTAVMNQQLLKGLGLFHYASELAPQLPEAFHGLGIVNTYLKRFDEAITAFSQIIQLSESPPGMVAESLFNRSSLRLNKGNKAAAIADLENCIKLCNDPAVLFPYFNDAEKEQAFVQGLEQKLNTLLSTP